MDQGIILLDIAKQLKRIANALDQRNEIEEWRKNR